MPAADTVLVVTHGLTMRLILMQLQGWSPNTFHTVWNAGNCEMYVLDLQLNRPGFSPYVLSEMDGDQLRSTANVLCHFKDTCQQQPRLLPLHDFLSLPPPRTAQSSLALKMLAKQHGFDPANVSHVEFQRTS